MPVYEYKAITAKGMIVTNKIEEENRKAVLNKLKRNELTTISVVELKAASRRKKKKKKKNIKDVQDMLKDINTANINTNRADRKKVSFLKKIQNSLNKNEKITNRDVVVFTQNFYLLKKANFNNIHALTTIIQSTENYEFKEILEDILAGVEAGEYMYTTMEYYSYVFPPIYISMIKVGELSGSLTNSLQQAVKYLDDSNDLTKKIKKILVPNIIQLVTILILLVVGTLFAIPAIQNVFDQVGSTDQLPKITLWFADVLDKFIASWYIPVIIIGVITAAILYYINTPKGKYNFHYFKYTMPIFGKLIYAVDFSRLLKAIELNLNNGMRIQEALDVSKNIVKNYVMLSMIETSINNIIIGQSWITPFEKSGLSSPMITEMLKIGMQTDLAEMMSKLIEYMEMDINNILEKIIAVLPQLLYGIVGIVLIFFTLVVLVPCIQVYMGGFLFSAAGV